MIARMGVDSDTEIARDLDVTISAVAQQRRKRGIARSPKAALQPHVWSEKDDRQLGSMPDGQLAAELGVSKASIERRRMQLGIPPYNNKPNRRMPRRLTGARYAKDREAGAPIADIARKYEVTSATVTKALQRYQARVEAERGDQGRRR